METEELINNEEYQEEERPQQEVEPPKTAKELWMEIGRLLLLLLWAITKKLIRVTYKSVRFLYRFCKLCVKATIEWWNDKDTQEKIRSIRKKIKRGCQIALQYTKTGCKHLWRWTVAGSKAAWKYSIIAAKLTWVGIVWLCVNLVQLIIHMKPTLIRMGKAIKQGFRQSVAAMKRMRRGMKLSGIRRRRRYQEFKRKGGMKGALENANRGLKAAISSYMEEEQNEVAPDAITEDDLLEERFEEIEQANRAHTISKKFFSSVKNIVESEE